MSETRLEELRMVDPVLTTVAQGYTNNSMIAAELFPVVSVAKLKGKIPVFGKESFIPRDTQRAIRAQSNRIPPGELDMIDFMTQEQDVETAIDYLEEEEAHDFLRYEQRITKSLMDIILLGHEKAAADLVQNPDNYDSGLKAEISAEDAWNNGGGGHDPILDIREGLAAVRARIGKYPNTMIIGDAAYQALLDNTILLEKVKYSGATTINTSIIRELTGIPRILTGIGVYTADGTTFTDIWSDTVVLAYVDGGESGRSEFNPSFGYTFRREGKPEVDSYYENGGKIKVIRCTDNYAIKVTASDAAYLIYNTNH